ncbi:MAG: TrbG/VirB9 family P-type conjugative transfer protein [Rhodocyclales bacterium]|nr:TrbG/VirB9 family P-type conjugative transfer protein [Rhodocyclales bacterium]
MVPAAVAGGASGGAAARVSAAAASLEDPRIRRIEYSPDAVVTVHTRRGQVTHIVLAADEQLIGDPATGQGANCEAPQDTWCVAVGETRRDIFVKPREGALINNLSVITSRRRYAFELVPLDKGLAAMRVVITLPAPPPAPVAVQVEAPRPPAIAMPEVPRPLSAEELVANRMRATALVRNAEYSVAVGPKGEDLVPTMVFDDGRATYFRFAGNAPLPAIFIAAPDGSEETVNTRMGEDGLLVADRVGKRFLLRLGDAVAAVINEAFDREGHRPKDGTVVPGVSRVVVMDKSSVTGQDTGGTQR